MSAAITKSYQIKKRDFVHAGKAAIEVKKILKSLNLPSPVIRKAAVCGYEAEMNIVMHASSHGKMELEISKDEILLTVSDMGPGIEDIEQAMQQGFSTASDDLREMGFGAGMGLPNIKKNADVLHIESKKNMGTTIKMAFSTGSLK